MKEQQQCLISATIREQLKSSCWLLLFGLFLLGCTPAESPYAQEGEFQLAAPSVDTDQVFFKNQNILRLRLNYDGVNIHYTLDGSTPTEQSPRYEQPIDLNQSALLQARAYHTCCQPSEIITAQFFEVSKVPSVRQITLNREGSEQYPGRGAAGLVDLEKGTTNFREPAWLGFAGGTIEALVELEERRPLRRVTASMLADAGSWIFLPAAMKVAVSEEGETFVDVGRKELEAPREEAAGGQQFISLSFASEAVRFVKIELEGLSAIPDWHPGKGTPPWLFIDELLIE
ncbi:MAG: FN3 associated domain-containing protein [Bacteroidota bacterium]